MHKIDMCNICNMINLKISKFKSNNFLAFDINLMGDEVLHQEQLCTQTVLELA